MATAVDGKDTFGGNGETVLLSRGSSPPGRGSKRTSGFGTSGPERGADTMPNGRHCDFRQPELGLCTEDSNTAATDQKSTVVEGWEPQAR